MTLPRFLLQYENQHSRIDTAIEECAENIVINALFLRIGAVPILGNGDMSETRRHSRICESGKELDL